MINIAAVRAFFMEKSKKPLMQLQVSMLRRTLISAGIMFALIFFVYYFKIPNPNMILIAGLVLASALFGFCGGIVASVIMFGYTLFFFSTGHSFIHFTPENMQKVIVSLAGMIADVFLVCFLKQTELRAFKKIDALTKELNFENKKLQHMYMTDALTGIRNRMALIDDLEFYLGHEISVMMVDLNDFKMINDTYGHEEGDHMLVETGKFLVDIFGENHCYRYGGDEFLVIFPDISEADFNKIFTCLSAGYVHAVMENINMLHTLISQADKKMYEVKRAHQAAKKTKNKKNQEQEFSHPQLPI